MLGLFLFPLGPTEMIVIRNLKLSMDLSQEINESES